MPSGCAFATDLAQLTGGEDDGGAFVEDAFGAVHRKHASVYDVATLLPHYCGNLVRDELAVLRQLTGEPERPYVVVLGGSKVSDKLAVIDSLLPKVDQLLVGGGMCFTFLAALGNEVGESLLEADRIDDCARLLAHSGDKIVLPTDIVVADRDRRRRRRPQVVSAYAIPAGAMGLDIGPASVAEFARRAGRRADGVLERADGRLRGRAVRRRHPRRRRGGRGDARA